jgi:hypothetical protein
VLDADGATIVAVRGDGAGIHTLDSAKPGRALGRKVPSKAESTRFPNTGCSNAGWYRCNQ